MKKISFYISPFVFCSIAWSQEVVLPNITVFGDTTKTSTLDFIPTVSDVSGAELERKIQPSLGETLGHELGVSSTFFGPNASRPVIRGLEGERIRILNNSLGVLDASGASQDHGVAVEPLIIERVEVIRGPGALLYGSSAIGGVVNVVTNRILEHSPAKLDGKLGARYTSVDDGASGALSLDYGVEDWAFHVDGSTRKTNDYEVPDFTTETVPNSESQTYSGAFGTSYIFKDGFAGASYSKYNSKYGTVAEPGVDIHMDQERVDVAAGVRNMGWIESIRLKAAYSDYKHEELEGSEVGTVFKNKGHESRLEMKHKGLGSWRGLIGLQSHFFDFSAIGEESFLPSTENKNLSVFLFEEASFGRWTPSFGLRLESASVSASETFVDVDPNNLGEASRGGPSDKRSFTPKSASLGVMYDLSQENALVLNLAYTERAPNYQELYANGAHMATNAFERGDQNLALEKSHSAELSFRHEEDSTRGSAGIFVQDFKDYIALSPQAGGGFDPEGAPGNRDLDFYQYEAVSARFYGAEVEISHDLPKLIPGGILEIGLRLDMVRAKNRESGESLPRITPMRETLMAIYRANDYTLDGEIQHVHEQSDLAPNETSTGSYTLVNIGAETPVRVWETTLSLYGRINNLFDQRAHNHVSLIKDVAPLPGRNVIVGLQASF